MQPTDIIVPESVFEMTESQESLCIINPVMLRALRLGQIIKVSAVPDNEFHEDWTDKLAQLPTRTYVCDEIRECSWRRVSRFEWAHNLGPDNIVDFARHFGPRDVEGRFTNEFDVRITHLSQPKHSLKSFDRRYRIAMQSQK